MNGKLSLFVTLPLLAGCGLAYGAGAGVHHEEIGYGGPYGYDVAYGGGASYDYEYGRHVNYRRLPVPRSYVPVPGRCRVWLPGAAPDRQPRSGSCRVLEHRVPRGGWLLVRPYRHPEVVELVVHDDRRGVHTRYGYDVRTRRRVNGYH